MMRAAGVAASALRHKASLPLMAELLVIRHAISAVARWRILAARRCQVRACLMIFC